MRSHDSYRKGYTTVPVMIGLLVVAVIGMYYAFQVYTGAYVPAETTTLSNAGDLAMLQKMQGGTTMSPKDVVAQYGPPNTTPKSSQSSDGHDETPMPEYADIAGPVGVSAPGMSRYVDVDFGFSFWYPDTWTVENVPVNPHQTYVYSGGVVTKQLTVRSGTDSNTAISIEEVHSETRTIGGFGNLGDEGPTSYFFDADTHTWMVKSSDDEISSADVSDNTMGGLHILYGSAHSVIIPLSAKDFLVISSSLAVPHGPLAKTIVAADPDVATPVSAAEQNATIQAEKNAYANNADAALIATPMTGKAPLTVSFDAIQSAGDETINFGDGKYVTTACPDGPRPECVNTSSSRGGLTAMHTYTTPGKYTATLSRSLPSTVLGTVTVVVQ